MKLAMPMAMSITKWWNWLVFQSIFAKLRYVSSEIGWKIGAFRHFYLESFNWSMPSTNRTIDNINFFFFSFWFHAPILLLLHRWIVQTVRAREKKFNSQAFVEVGISLLRSTLIQLLKCSAKQRTNPNRATDHCESGQI